MMGLQATVLKSSYLYYALSCLYLVSDLSPAQAYAIKKFMDV